jgi:hypothetical protein
MARNKQDRKTVEIDRKRIPLRSLIHGKEIRDAAKSLEEFRMKLNEKEFLYGAKLYIDWKDYSTVDIVARRLETDKEYEDRLEKARIAAEQKALRDRKRAAEAVKRAELEQFRQRAAAVENLRKTAKQLGLSGKDLVDLLA